MSRTRINPAKLVCARCGRAVRLGAAHWPEGYLCPTCHTHALETYGRCAGCGVDRLTPGIAPDGGRWCTDCAGGLGDFFCQLCGREGRRYRRGVCGNCVLAERLRVLLDDGTGGIRPELALFVEGFCPMRRARAGLTWITNHHNRLLPRLVIPHQSTANPAPISQRQHLEMIHRLLTDEDLPLLTRVAATLMLLYAQPLTRILRLSTDAVLVDDGEVSIRLGDPPSPVPEPFASLLLRHIDQRLNLTTATNQHARWLFPGRRGGQPMTPATIEGRLRRHGIPGLNGRTAALRQLVLQTPAPVVARMLGYTHQQTARVAADAGSPWSRYAPGDNHTQRQPRTPQPPIRDS